MAKQMPEPIAVLVKGEYVPNIPGVVPKGKTGELERVVRNMCLLDCAEDGTYVRMWSSTAFSAEDNCVWYPKWIFDKVVGKFGPPVPTGQGFGGDFDIMECNFKQWEQAAKWQADSINYMIHEEGVEVVFSHFHGPDMAGHTYMRTLKEREGESRKGEETYYNYAVGTHEMADEYIGEFLPLLDEGWTIFLVSDHALVCPEYERPAFGDPYGVNVGVMRALGFTVMKKDENGNLVGIWGAMSDCSHSYKPWEDNFSKGLYLAGVECVDDAEAPQGWTKWTIPGFEYICIETENENTFAEVLSYMNANNIALVGAVHDYTCPLNGKNYMYFPIRTI